MSDLEHLRKDAKRLLKQCRAGDAGAIARVRSRLPQLANLADAEFSRRLQLAHIQHALAHEQGAENWASMKGISDTVLENLLHEVRNTGNISGRQLSVAADFAEESIYAACIIGDSDGVLRHLEVDPSLVFAQRSGWTPLHYIVASSVYKLSKRHAAGITQCAMVLLDRNADPYARTSGNAADKKAITAVALAERSKNQTLVNPR